MLRHAIAALAIALMACGCTAQPRASAAAAGSPPVKLNAAHLSGTEWHFVEVAGASVPAVITATMRLRDGRAAGKAGCNAYAARYRIARDGPATFQLGMPTKMACMEPSGVMKVQHGIFAALRHATTVELADGQLVLLDAAGRPLAKLAQAGSR